MQPIDRSLQPVVFPFPDCCAKLGPMNTKPVLLLIIGIVILCSFATGARQTTTTNLPSYTPDGQLRLPESYREWVYLSTGFDMSYNPAMRGMDHHMFDNVFVNPEAYRGFLRTGTWPDKTILVLEGRRAQNKGSINQNGHFQSEDVMAVEVHIKDESRFGGQGNWAFFGFGDEKTSKMIPQTADCYSCHSQHAAVDTTFVQFYPTILSIARSHNTLSAGYTKESAAKP